MISLLLIFTLFAHEDLDSTKCSLGKQSIEVKKISSQKYEIKTPDMKTAKSFPAPAIKDYWDAPIKQMFDTYTFKEVGFLLVVKRPETKGPIKSNRAFWNGKIFNCQ